MTEVFPAYRAEFEFRRSDRHIHTVYATYSAATCADAVRDAVRFWNGRHNTIPDHFTKILCIKVARYLIGPIAEDGSLTNPGNFDFFEYKCDTAGLPLAEYVEYRCSELERRLRK